MVYSITFEKNYNRMKSVILGSVITIRDEVWVTDINL